ncbi:MAG: hypothetical protein HY575_01110 [candidate division NC10 bacterium]|nr:hypothetical protein [candidate division NC10 bacterium]
MGEAVARIVDRSPDFFARAAAVPAFLDPADLSGWRFGRRRDMDPAILDRINRGLLLRTGAYLVNDHFLLPSGRHAGEYVEKNLVSTEPAFSEGLGEVLARQFAKEVLDVVFTSGMGATLLGHAVARAHPSKPKLLYAVKSRGEAGEASVILPPEFEASLSAGSRTLIVEDILTTGETIRALIRLVEERRGRVVGVGCLLNRDRQVHFTSPFFALVTKDFPTYRPEECPMCRRGMPLREPHGNPGSGGKAAGRSRPRRKPT